MTWWATSSIFVTAARARGSSRSEPGSFWTDLADGSVVISVTLKLDTEAQRSQRMHRDLFLENYFSLLCEPAVTSVPLCLSFCSTCFRFRDFGEEFVDDFIGGLA